MSATSTPQQYLLLAGLPAEVQGRIVPHLELAPMPLGKVLYESGDTLRQVYFPTDSIISLLYVMQNGASAEISVVGNEGVVGIPLFMGGESTTGRAMVQSAGHAYRLPAKRFKDEVERHGELLHLMLHYTPRHCSPKWPRRRSATVTTRPTSSCAAGSCSRWTGLRATNCP